MLTDTLKTARTRHRLASFLAMPLDDAGMHRAGLAFVYRIVPVLVATILYGSCACS
jgi:hypothetical protein